MPLAQSIRIESIDAVAVQILNHHFMSWNIEVDMHAHLNFLYIQIQTINADSQTAVLCH